MDIRPVKFSFQQPQSFWGIEPILIVCVITPMRNITTRVHMVLTMNVD